MPETAQSWRAADTLLLQVARRQRAAIAVLGCAVLLDTAATLAVPAMLAVAVDGVLRGSTSGVLPFLAVLAIATASEALVQFAGPYCTLTAAATIRHRLVRHVLAAGVPGTQRFAAGDLVGRVLGNAADASGAAAAAANGAAAIVTSLGGVVALALIDPYLAVVFLVGVPIGVRLIHTFVRDAGRHVARYQAVQAQIAARLLDALGGIRTIRACGTAELEADRVLVPLPQLAASGRMLWRSQRDVVWRSALLAPMLQIAVLAAAGYGVVTGRLTAGQLLAAAGYAALGLGFFGNAQVLLGLARARAGALRVAGVLAAPVLRSGTGPVPPGRGRLEFRDVTVRDPAGRPILDRLNLVVPAGCTVAVVGRSGAGKSTVAALAGRLRDPDGGVVALDGALLASMDPAALRREVAYAFERPALVACPPNGTARGAVGGTVGGAIGFGAGRVSRAEVVHAAKAAQADGFVRRLPAGYDTELAAAPLSGGEVQRLGLARALAHGGRLLILDDATSSLDTVTEMQVARAVATADPGRTRLVVAHRAATAARADLVAWLDTGRLRAYAPHHELWHDARYRAVFGAGPAEPVSAGEQAWPGPG